MALPPTAGSDVRRLQTPEGCDWRPNLEARDYRGAQSMPARDMNFVPELGTWGRKLSAKHDSMIAPVSLHAERRESSNQSRIPQSDTRLPSAHSGSMRESGVKIKKIETVTLPMSTRDIGSLPQSTVHLRDGTTYTGVDLNGDGIPDSLENAGAVIMERPPSPLPVPQSGVDQVWLDSIVNNLKREMNSQLDVVVGRLLELEGAYGHQDGQIASLFANQSQPMQDENYFMQLHSDVGAKHDHVMGCLNKHADEVDDKFRKTEARLAQHVDSVAGENLQRLQLVVNQLCVDNQSMKEKHEHLEARFLGTATLDAALTQQATSKAKELEEAFDQHESMIKALEGCLQDSAQVSEDLRIRVYQLESGPQRRMHENDDRLDRERLDDLHQKLNALHSQHAELRHYDDGQANQRQDLKERVLECEVQLKSLGRRLQDFNDLEARIMASQDKLTEIQISMVESGTHRGKVSELEDKLEGLKTAQAAAHRAFDKEIIAKAKEEHRAHADQIMSWIRGEHSAKERAWNTHAKMMEDKLELHKKEHSDRLGKLQVQGSPLDCERLQGHLRKIQDDHAQAHEGHHSMFQDFKDWVSDQFAAHSEKVDAHAKTVEDRLQLHKQEHAGQLQEHGRMFGERIDSHKELIESHRAAYSHQLKEYGSLAGERNFSSDDAMQNLKERLLESEQKLSFSVSNMERVQDLIEAKALELTDNTDLVRRIEMLEGGSRSSLGNQSRSLSDVPRGVRGEYTTRAELDEELEIMRSQFVERIAQLSLIPKGANAQEALQGLQDKIWEHDLALRKVRQNEDTTERILDKLSVIQNHTANARSANAPDMNTQAKLAEHDKYLKKLHVMAGKVDERLDRIEETTSTLIKTEEATLSLIDRGAGDQPKQRQALDADKLAEHDKYLRKLHVMAAKVDERLDALEETTSTLIRTEEATLSMIDQGAGGGADIARVRNSIARDQVEDLSKSMSRVHKDHADRLEKLEQVGTMSDKLTHQHMVRLDKLENASDLTHHYEDRIQKLEKQQQKIPGVHKDHTDRLQKLEHQSAGADKLTHQHMVRLDKLENASDLTHHYEDRIQKLEKHLQRVPADKMLATHKDHADRLQKLEKIAPSADKLTHQHMVRLDKLENASDLTHHYEDRIQKLEKQLPAAQSKQAAARSEVTATTVKDKLAEHDKSLSKLVDITKRLSDNAKLGDNAIGRGNNSPRNHLYATAAALQTEREERIRENISCHYQIRTEMTRLMKHVYIQHEGSKFGSPPTLQRTLYEMDKKEYGTTENKLMAEAMKGDGDRLALISDLRAAVQEEKKHRIIQVRSIISGHGDPEEAPHEGVLASAKHAFAHMLHLDGESKEPEEGAQDTSTKPARDARTPSPMDGRTQSQDAKARHDMIQQRLADLDRAREKLDHTHDTKSGARSGANQEETSDRKATPPREGLISRTVHSLFPGSST